MANIRETNEAVVVRIRAVKKVVDTCVEEIELNIVKLKDIVKGLDESYFVDSVKGLNKDIALLNKELNIEKTKSELLNSYILDWEYTEDEECYQELQDFVPRLKEMERVTIV